MAKHWRRTWQTTTTLGCALPCHFTAHGIQLECGAWLQRPDMDLAEELAAEAEWAEANDHQGPHSLIGQPEMRLFWRRCFGCQEEVTWDGFWAHFPKDVSRRALLARSVVQKPS